MTMSVPALFKWLEGTWASVAIRESILFYPFVETSHVLTLCLFLGMTAMWDLRLVGIAFRQVPVSEMIARLLPWAVAGFLLMVTSGALLFLSSPVRASQNVFFQIKMAAIVLAGLNAFVFHKTVFRRVTEWGHTDTVPFRARVAGSFSLLLWSVVLVCGRMQAYNWFD